MSYAEKELIKQLAKNPNIKTVEDAQNAIKSLFGGLIQQMLKAEMEEYLGYSKHDYTNTTNSCNGKSTKTVKSDISRLESSIIDMYTKGISTRYISSQVNEIYVMDVSPTLISDITDKIIPSIKVAMQTIRKYISYRLYRFYSF